MATLAELDALVDANQNAFSGIAAAYEVLLGGVPSIDGFVFLINNAKATNFGSNNPSIEFNQENIFINLTNALVQGNPAALAKFQAITQGAATLSDKLGAIYDAYVPAANQTVEGRAFFTRAEAQDFYTRVAAERGVAGADGAAIVGLASLLKILVTEDAGLGDAVNDLRAAIDDGSAVLPTDGAVFTPIETADGTHFDQDDPDLGIRLTEGTDIVSGNVFYAPRGYTPGGTDQVNTLNDDDVLTGTGTNPTLNFTFVNDADTGDNNIVPTLNGIETINIDVRGEDPAELDLQNATGVKNINIFGLDDNADFGIDNIQDAGGAAGLNLSINNSGDDDASVYFEFDATAVAGAADVVNLTLNDADLGYLSIDDENGTSGLGIETLNLVSKGGANRVEEFNLEDGEAVKITGDSKLELGDQFEIVRAGTSQVESFSRSAGFVNVAGSLKSIDASGLGAGIKINLGEETIANQDGTSGTKVDFNFVGTGFDDTIRLLAGLDTNDDKIAGGAGNDTVQVYASVTKGSVTDVENLDIRNNNSTITVDASLFTGLKTIMLRNESNNGSVSTSGTAIYNLNKLTAEQAANLVVQHSSTESNDVSENVINAKLATDTASDLLGLKITDQADGEDRGVNVDPRFNLTVNGAKFENLTFTDVDTESNSVLVTNIADVKGTITVLGENQAGNFFNLDSTANALQLDQSGGDVDGDSYSDPGNGAADRFSGAKVDASAYTGDLVVRVSNNAALPTGAQTILGGKGNDHIIFDALNNTTAGLTISDTVNGGDGDDTLYLDGDGKLINVGASEWTNVSNIETIHLIGQNLAGSNLASAPGANDAYGKNSYNLTLTNDLIAKNGEAVAGGRVINIVNDNDPLNGVGVADDAGAANSFGVTIDARTLNAQSNFTYDGEEGAGQTADRFIMADANVNGVAVIDGGAILGGGNVASNLANQDVLEVRNQAVVTIGDLVGVSNVGTIEFTNDQAATQTAFLELDNATVDRLVNSSQAASATAGTETLTIAAYDNPLLVGAHTVLTVDASQVTNHYLSLDITGGFGSDKITGGAGNDTIDLGWDTAALARGDGAADLVLVAPSSAGSSDTVENFESVAFGGDTADDVLDLSGFGIVGATVAYTAAALAEGAAMVDDVLSFVVPGANAGDNIFYVDVNQDGIFNAASDYSVRLVDSGDILWGTNLIV